MPKGDYTRDALMAKAAKSEQHWLDVQISRDLGRSMSSYSASYGVLGMY